MVGEAIATGALTFEHVSTDENLADLFTKPLGGIKFWGITKQFLHRVLPDEPRALVGSRPSPNFKERACTLTAVSRSNQHMCTTGLPRR